MKILIAVYNSIERDARVQRQIVALSEHYSIDVLCCGKLDESKVDFIAIEEGKSFQEISYKQYVHKFLMLVGYNAYDIVYGNDYYSCLPMLLAKRKKGTKWIYDAHELIIDCREPRERFFRLMEKLIINRMDSVICASDQRSEIMKDYYKMKIAPIVVRNISKMVINAHEINKSELQILESDTFKIIYVGVLKAGRKIELLCKAAKQLGAGFSIIIVGDGEQYEYLREMCTNENITNVFLFGGKSSGDLGNYIGRCDIGYLYYPCTDMNNKYCAPNKIYEYTSLGIPLVSNDNPTMQKEIERYKLGAVFAEKQTDWNTVQEIIKAILNVANSIRDYKLATINFAHNNSWDNEAQRLFETVERGN